MTHCRVAHSYIFGFRPTYIFRGGLWITNLIHG